jgi:hypothetical protein
MHDKVALAALRAIRASFDWATGYGHEMTATKYWTRFTFLETVAGVPVRRSFVSCAPSDCASSLASGVCRALTSARAGPARHRDRIP